MRPTILNHVRFGLFTAARRDILGSVDIGMRFVSAPATLKVRLITAVALLTVATVGARPAGVARIDKLHPDSWNAQGCSCLRVIIEIGLLLIKPGFSATAIRFTIGTSFAETGQAEESEPQWPYTRRTSSLASSILQ